MKFKRWELALMILAIIVVLFSVGRLRSDHKLYPRLFGMKDWSGVEEPVIGKLEYVQAEVKRQSAQSSVFMAVQKNATLFNYDLVFTGNQSLAKLVLNNGGVVEFGPNTMARIAVEAQIGFQGISRVEVVSGTVTASAKDQTILLQSQDGQIKTISKNQNQSLTVAAVPHIKTKEASELLTESNAKLPAAIAPVATPSSIAVVQATPMPEAAKDQVLVNVISPVEGSMLQIVKDSHDFALPLKVEAKIETQFEGKDSLKIQIFKNSKIKSENSKAVFSRTLDQKTPSFSVMTQLKAPGSYRVVSEGKVKVQFTVKDEFEAIHLYPPKVGGLPLEVVKSEIHSSDNYDVTLRWEPFPRATEYTAVFALPKEPEKIVMQHKVKTPFYSFNIGKVFQGSFLYRIMVQDSSGFKAVSQWDLFDFSLKSPTLTSPSNGIEFESGKTVEVVWSKSSFSDAYDLEVYHDAQMTKAFLRKRIKTNFYYLRDLEAGSYFWRVRAISKTVPSAYSSTGSFRIK